MANKVKRQDRQGRQDSPTNNLKEVNKMKGFNSFTNKEQEVNKHYFTDYLSPEKQKDISYKGYKGRCEHGIVGYCKKCLEALPSESEEVKTFTYSHDLKQSKINLLIDDYSFGCLVCNYHIKNTVKGSIINYAKKKGYHIADHDIEDTIQESFEYILKCMKKGKEGKRNRWEETIQKSIEQGFTPMQAFCRLAHSRLKNIIRQQVKQAIIESIDKMIVDSESISQLKSADSEQVLCNLKLQLEDLLKNRQVSELHISIVILRYRGYTLKEIGDRVKEIGLELSENELYYMLNQVNKELKK